MNKSCRSDELKILGWSDKDVALYEELFEYRRRWGAINIEPHERAFLRTADQALSKLASSVTSLKQNNRASLTEDSQHLLAKVSFRNSAAKTPSMGKIQTKNYCFVALDFETADHGRDSACSVAIVRVEKKSIVHREHHLICPPRQRFTFSHIHGIRWSHVMNAPSFKELWPELKPCFEGAQFIAAHNAGFDQSVLQACCQHANVLAPAHPYLCTVQLARKTWDIRPTKLPNVCEHLRLNLNHHDALSDAEACANIVLAAIRDGGL